MGNPWVFFHFQDGMHKKVQASQAYSPELQERPKSTWLILDTTSINLAAKHCRTIRKPRHYTQLCLWPWPKGQYARGWTACASKSERVLWGLVCSMDHFWGDATRPHASGECAMILVTSGIIIDCLYHHSMRIKCGIYVIPYCSYYAIFTSSHQPSWLCYLSVQAGIIWIYGHILCT